MRISLLVGCILFLYSWSQSAFSVSYSETLSQPCNGCHGPDGVSAGKSIPSIAGLDIRYFMRTMLRFKRNERVATIMDRIAQGYEVTELKKISTYFSELEWRNASIRNIDEKERQKAGISMTNYAWSAMKTTADTKTRKSPESRVNQ